MSDTTVGLATEILDRAPSSPECALAAAVLLRAVEDAQLRGCSPWIHGVRMEARQFLIAGGQWAWQRAFWADMAGIDPAYLSRRVREVLH